MTRLAVTADIHCDDFGSKVDAATGLNARWVDTVAMLRWVARDAKARQADALIIAGDLSESRHPAPWRVAQIGEAIAEYDGIVILARGNHDGARAGRSIVDVLAAGRPGWTGFSVPGVTRVGDTAIAVLPFLDRHHARALPGFEAVPDAELSGALGSMYLTIAGGLQVAAAALAPRTVLVVHQALAGGLMSDSQAAFLGDQGLIVDTRALTALGFDAVLAGHFHKHQVISEQPLVAYTGSPYRTDFGEEHQAKGYLIVDVDTDGTTGIGVTATTFIETPARRFVTLTGDQINDDVAEDQVEGAIVRVVDLEERIDPAQVRRMLENLGAFEVTEVRRRPVDPGVSAGGMAESLTAEQALETYFVNDVDRAVLIERGRGILEEVVA